jgi:hypothetical protein
LGKTPFASAKGVFLSSAPMAKPPYGSSSPIERIPSEKQGEFMKLGIKD